MTTHRRDRTFRAGDYLMVKNVRFGVMAMTLALGCEGASVTTGGASSTGTGLGGSGGGVVASGGTGGAAMTTSATGTTSTAVPVCEVPDPGCDYPDPLLSYEPETIVYDLFAPIPWWETNGASEGCVGPFLADLVIGRVVVGFPWSMVPESIPVRVQVRDDLALDDAAPDYTTALLEDTEDGPDGTTLGVYALPESMLALAGKYACVALPLSEHTPVVMHQGECADHRRSRWLGLPVKGVPVMQTWPAEQLTWAYLHCPIDTTTDDGTPAVGSYAGDFLRGVRE